MAKPLAPLRHLYPRITSFPNLLAAFRKASKGKRYRAEVLVFGAKLEEELFRLQWELESFTYAPGPYRQFLVHEPKRRLVSAAPSPPATPTARAMAPTAPFAASVAPAGSTAGSSRPTSASISRALITVCSWLSWRG